MKVGINKKAAVSVALCTFIVAVIFLFSVKPKVTVIGAEAARVEVFGEYEEAGATAEFLFFDLSDRIVSSGAVDTEKVGEYAVTYTVTFLRKTASAVRTVAVTDTVMPVISLIGDSDMRLEDISFFEEPGVNASDNYDGDITATVVTRRTETKFTTGERVGETEYVFTYSVSDSSGNTASAERTVVTKDETPPVITLNGENTVTVIVGSEFKDPGAVAADNVTENISVTAHGSVDTSVPGSYLIEYYAEDAAGNKATAERKVTVRAAVPLHPHGEPLVPGGSYIALTFDDGPSENTSRILDILSEKNIKATFFVLNYSDDRIPVLKRMASEGHTIAIHSYSHVYSDIYSSPDAYMQGVYSLQDKIYRDTGFSADVLRFPGGSSNTVSRSYCTGVMSALTKRVTEEGFSYFDWNVDSGDADGNCKPADYIVGHVNGSLVKGRVNVVLMHDSSPKTTTVQALPEIIDNAVKCGYTFIPLSPSVPPVHHGVNN